MEKFKFLSGEEIVAKGATKLETTLPEIGLKDVKPDGSWLEQKQIQSALEARKHLVEAQRIDKSGILSHAEWRDELNLAEVTQQMGGFWQFLGHHKDKKLYLRPEEALYLMETNYLLLKYSGVKVSLQQAYSLLLSDDFSIIQYKVYASLSRLGYKVFRHIAKSDDSNVCKKSNDPVADANKINTGNTDNKRKLVVESEVTKINDNNTMEVENTNAETDGNSNVTQLSKESEDKLDNTEDNTNKEKTISLENNNSNNTLMDVDVIAIDNSGVSQIKRSSQSQVPDKSNDNKTISDACSPSNNNDSSNIDPLRRYCQWKFEKLKSRRKIFKTTDVHKYFENCPDLLENKIVTIKVPNEEYIPKNVFLNNLCYVLNIDNIRKKNNTPFPTESPYSISDEVNGAHIRRVTDAVGLNRSNPQQQRNSIPNFYQNFRPNIPFRHFGYFRPRTNTHYFQFNLFYQRPFMGNFNSRFQFFPRMHMPMFPGYTNNIPSNANVDGNTETPHGQRRRRLTPKTLHLEAIKNLAVRLKQLTHTGIMRTDNILALQRIINTYNDRYRARLRLTDDFEIVNDETIVDTIELIDDEEEHRAKKPRLADTSDLAQENLNNIRQIASKLKAMEAQDKTTARHRRALSSLIKTFNKSFNADIYVNDAFQVLDRRHINLDSDSDSDCVIEVRPKVTGKKLRNPFNILKRLSEKQVGPATTSQHKPTETIPESEYNDLYESLKKTFKKPWLPDKNDFGRPEITVRDTMNARIIETKKEEYLFDFYRNQSSKCNNWLDIKISFLENIEDTNAILHTEAMMDNNIDLRSLVRPEDCTDMSAVLNKLRIIKANKGVKEECNLAIHFDVYNRNVSNFRKTDRPTPHFRVVCIDETSDYHTGIDIATLHSKYKNETAILFAVVGIGSISFVQMIATDLPMYVPCNDSGILGHRKAQNTEAKAVFFRLHSAWHTLK